MSRTSHVVTLVALLILKISTMAKHNLFLGQARGKIGSVVFSRLNGVQISRAYNPSPKNPKSWAQATQRAAFASISQYYKVFRYLIEQGQQGIKVGQPSVQDWQSRTLKQLTGQIGSTPMVLNAKGVQYPQLLPVSLTNGSLPSLTYDIRKYGHYPATPKYGLCLTFNNSYTTTEALAAMTLGDLYAITPGLQRGFQLTFALLGWTFPMDIFDHYNRANAAMWAQYVIAEDADETSPFFVAVEGQANEVQINPEIITSSWGERFTPRWSLRVIDGNAVAFLDAPEYESPSPGGIIAGSCITSYYNGSEWARSTSPMAIAADFSTTDQTDMIETYQRAAKSTSSDLYLNQAKTKAAATSATKMTYSGIEIRSADGESTLVLESEMGVSLFASAEGSYYSNIATADISLEFEQPFNQPISVTVGEGGQLPQSYTVEGIGSKDIDIHIPIVLVTGGAGTSATVTIKAGDYTREFTYNMTQN